MIFYLGNNFLCISYTIYFSIFKVYFSMIDEILKFNKQFVADKGYEKYITTKYPDKKIAIVASGFGHQERRCEND